MPAIDDLKVSFLDMSPAEQHGLIHKIREARRTRPESPKKIKKNAKGVRSADAKIRKTKAVKDIDPMTLAASMSSEAKRKLLKELGYDLD